MNKIGGSFFIIIVFFGKVSTVLAENALVIDFSGELVSTACTVSSDSINKEVKLDNLRWQYINENITSESTMFSIGIENCSVTDLQKSIELTWQSNQLVNVNGEKFLTTQGSSGILLGVHDKDDNPIIWNKAFTLGAVSVVEGIQQFDFNVFARKPINGEANAGRFSGVATFNVEYK
jgi:type 1 fimbria pilin